MWCFFKPDFCNTKKINKIPIDEIKKGALYTVFFYFGTPLKVQVNIGWTDKTLQKAHLRFLRIVHTKFQRLISIWKGTTTKNKFRLLEKLDKKLIFEQWGCRYIADEEFTRPKTTSKNPTFTRQIQTSCSSMWRKDAQKILLRGYDRVKWRLKSRILQKAHLRPRLNVHVKF